MLDPATAAVRIGSEVVPQHRVLAICSWPRRREESVPQVTPRLGPVPVLDLETATGYTILAGVLMGFDRQELEDYARGSGLWPAAASPYAGTTVIYDPSGSLSAGAGGAPPSEADAERAEAPHDASKGPLLVRALG